MRWRSEESYKFQKILLNMNCNYCRSVEGVEQDFWATVLLSMAMPVRFNEVEDEEEIRFQEEPGKINRSVVFGSLKNLYLKVIMGEASLEKFETCFNQLCKRHRYKVKPNRSFFRPSVNRRKTRHCHRRHV